MRYTARSDLSRIVVVGAGLAGVRSCEQLRHQGYEGELILIGAEQHAPYDRPPLSKDVLRGDRSESSLAVDLASLDVDVRLATTATGLDLAQRVLRVSTAETAEDVSGKTTRQFGFDGLVIATGANPIKLPGSGKQLVVRTIDDALQLRHRLNADTRLVIVGASWIGAEVATAALHRGCHVTCVEAGVAPSAQALGAETAKWLTPWWSDVDLRLNTPVRSVEKHAVVLDNGSELAADVVVVGVGVRPTTEWLSGSSLALERGGVVTDERLLAAPGIAAVGDAAAWWSRRYNSRMSVEHWDHAVAGSAVAAASLLQLRDSTELPTYDPVPYFWTDQFGHKLQYAGHHDVSAKPIFRKPANGKGWSVVWLDADQRLTAVLAVDRPRELLQGRRALQAGTKPDPGLLADPEVDLTAA